MLNFIGLSISIMLGIVLAMVVMFVLMLQPKVIKWYSNKIMKMLEQMIEDTTITTNTETESK